MSILEQGQEFRGGLIVKPSAAHVATLLDDTPYSKAYRQLQDLKRLVDTSLDVFRICPLVELTQDEQKCYAEMFKDATFVLGGRFEIRDLQAKTLDT